MDIYHNNEDERIVTSLVSMLYHDYAQEDLISTIIHKKIKRLPQIRKRLSLNEYCILCANIKTFLRTLYFRTKNDHNLTFTKHKAERMLKELPNYY